MKPTSCAISILRALDKKRKRTKRGGPAGFSPLLHHHQLPASAAMAVHNNSGKRGAKRSKGAKRKIPPARARRCWIRLRWWQCRHRHPSLSFHAARVAFRHLFARGDEAWVFWYVVTAVFLFSPRSRGLQWTYVYSGKVNERDRRIPFVFAPLTSTAALLLMEMRGAFMRIEVPFVWKKLKDNKKVCNVWWFHTRTSSSSFYSAQMFSSPFFYFVQFQCIQNSERSCENIVLMWKADKKKKRSYCMWKNKKKKKTSPIDHWQLHTECMHGCIAHAYPRTE